MAKKVENKDVIANDFLKPATKNAKEFLAIIEEIEIKIKEVAKAQKEVLTSSSNKTLKGLQKQQEARKKLNKAEEVAQTIRKQKNCLRKKTKCCK